MSVKIKVNDALDKVGTRNGTAVPATQDPAVAAMHEYLVSTVMESYAKKRRERAKSKLSDMLSNVQQDKLSLATMGVKKSQVSDTVLLIDSNPYKLQVKINNGATYLDEAKLRSKIIKDFKLTAVQADELFESCRDRRAPSASWEVVEV